MATRNFVYKQKHPKTGLVSNKVGMIIIFDEADMSRVPEGAVEVGDTPVEADPEGSYFEAWRLQDDGTVIVDIEAAKEVRMEYLRDRRDGLLLHLDSVQFRFYCSKNQEEVDRIEETKNSLRDFTEKINWDVIITLHDIRHILPPILV